MGERPLIETFASEEGVLYTSDPPQIEGVSSDPDDDKSERVRLLERALELESCHLLTGSHYIFYAPDTPFRS